MVACSCRDDKDKWIRAKYELREFLPPLPHGGIALSQASNMLCISVEARDSSFLFRHRQ